MANKKADAIDIEVVVEAVRKGTKGLDELKQMYEPLGLSEKAEEHYYRIRHQVVHLGWEKVFVCEIDSEDKTPQSGTEIIREPNTGIIKRFINWIITGFTNKLDDQ